MYSLEDYFGIDGDTLQKQTLVSPNAPTPTQVAGPSATAGKPGVVAGFTDWRHSPVFWLALFALLALGAIHGEVKLGAALR